MVKCKQQLIVSYLAKLGSIVIPMLILNTAFTQTIKRDPNPRKDEANFFYKPEYTLFDYWTDEPILPDSYGRYNIFCASNEVKTPSAFHGTAQQVANQKLYKFKNFQNCKNWCNGVIFTPGNSISHQTVYGLALSFQESNINSDSRIDSVIQLGEQSVRPQKLLNTSGISNSIKFYEKPLYLTKNVTAQQFRPKQSYKNYREEIEIVLRGLDSLSSIIKAYEIELSTYKVYKGRTVDNDFDSENMFWRLYKADAIFVIKDLSIKSKVVKWLKKYCTYNTIKRIETTMCAGKLVLTSSNSCHKIDKKLASAVKRGKLISIAPNKKLDFIKTVTGLDGRYFVIKEELNRTQKLYKYVSSKFILSLPSSKPTNQQHKYVGSTENNLPNGFGYLLTEDNLVLFSGFWQQGFPVLLYEVYGNRSVSGTSFDNAYIPVGIPAQTENLCILTMPRHNVDMGVFSFALYIGQYVRTSNITFSGFGTVFLSDFKENNLQYYQGFWENGEKNGQGVQYFGSITYDGLFENGEFVSGVSTSFNGEKQKGKFKNWRLQGVGEVTTANGVQRKGVYENGVFMKTIEQHEREVEAERLRQEELIAIQNAQNLKYQYGERIKEKFRKKMLVLAFQGKMTEAEKDAASDEIMADIEQNVLGRKLTYHDRDPLMELGKEVAAEIALGLKLINSTTLESSSGGQSNKKSCAWCGRIYTGKGYTAAGKYCNSYSDDSWYDNCCSKKCASEKCINKN